MNNKTTSIEFSEEYKICHRDIVNKIAKIIHEHPSLIDEFREIECRTTKNKKFIAYELTKNGLFLLLATTNTTGKGSKLLFEKKQEFIKSFLKMEEEIQALRKL